MGIEVFLFIAWIMVLITWVALFTTLKFKLNQPFNLVLFGLSLVFFRVAKGGFQVVSRPRQIRLPSLPAKPVVNKVADYNMAYNLKHTEVVTGENGNRIVRIDVMDEHTLLSASTGGAKTWLLHSWLIQLFDKGSRFIDNVKVYVVDFKGHHKDMWVEWQPLLTGFATRDNRGDITACLNLLKEIDRLLQVDVDERILLIIEEASLLTANKEGKDLFGNIASQLRLNGSVIVTIQHPHYSKMETFIKNNIARRIAGLVNNITQGETILEVRPSASDLPDEKGQYLMVQPGKRHLIKFTAMKPDLPAEIRETVAKGIEIMAETDQRLKIYREVCQGKKKGAAITGAQTLGKKLKWLPNAQFTLMVAYRNFVQAGIFIPPKGAGSHNTMAVDFEEGFALLRRFIDGGKWQQEAQKII